MEIRLDFCKKVDIYYVIMLLQTAEHYANWLYSIKRLNAKVYSENNSQHIDRLIVDYYPSAFTYFRNLTIFHSS